MTDAVDNCTEKMAVPDPLNDDRGPNDVLVFTSAAQRAHTSPTFLADAGFRHCSCYGPVSQAVLDREQCIASL